MKQLSKRESKYRLRFIAENHYNKREQKIFDDTVKQKGLSYVEIYKNQRQGDICFVELKISTDRIGQGLSKVSMSVAGVAEGLDLFSKVYRDLLKGSV